ncbi:TetR/AcrR family transcriptional regulator [Caulobacter henricii]|uniref:TetR family transcriptional regulator n=1 Tax=Caulobacter henricii TaxID=69395 RepID=A0A0P0P460_9CAUL|nr:TetR/AcrR family transcriptional regulator [Caulobacter henricii]ALL15108.1 TetR family transcriptional regulator [Caulobacter henricii]
MPRIPGQIDVAKTEAILDAAIEVIGQRGLSAPMEAIARHAGVSKQTVYNHYGCKAELVRALMARRVELITAPLRMPGAEENPQAALEAYARSILETVNGASSYSVMRVVIQGAGEMPEVAHEVFEAGPRHARRQLAAFLETETRLGRLQVEDFDQAAEFFSGMVLGHAQLRALLCLPADKTQAQFDDLAREAAKRFLKAYGP